MNETSNDSCCIRKVLGTRDAAGKFNSNVPETQGQSVLLPIRKAFKETKKNKLKWRSVPGGFHHQVLKKLCEYPESQNCEVEDVIQISFSYLIFSKL